DMASQYWPEIVLEWQRRLAELAKIRPVIVSTLRRVKRCKDLSKSAGILPRCSPSLPRSPGHRWDYGAADGDAIIGDHAEAATQRFMPTWPLIIESPFCAYLIPQTAGIWRTSMSY